jgi:hypothetical protein
MTTVTTMIPQAHASAVATGEREADAARRLYDAA